MSFGNRYQRYIQISLQRNTRAERKYSYRYSTSFCSSIKCLPPPLCFFLILDYTSRMKKLIIALLLLSVSGVFAAPKNLTIGETLTLYFNEIFPDESEEINDIMVNYGDIGSRT